MVCSSSMLLFTYMIDLARSGIPAGQSFTYEVPIDLQPPGTCTSSLYIDSGTHQIADWWHSHALVRTKPIITATSSNCLGGIRRWSSSTFVNSSCGRRTVQLRRRSDCNARRLVHGRGKAHRGQIPCSNRFGFSMISS